MSSPRAVDGAASLGDVIADVDARPASAIHDDRARGGACRNCDAPAPGNFCPNCGQSTTLHPPTAFEFVHEFLGHYVAIEGPLLRTLKALFVTPGRLTADYFAGRRQRYIPPLRLYLTISVILFAVASATGGLRLGGKGSREAIEFDVPVGSSRDAKVVGLHDGGDLPTWLRSTFQRIGDLTPQQRAERVRGAARQYLPYVLIVLVPVLALIFKLVYLRRGRLYGEHLVVAFHAQAAAFLFALVSSLPFGLWWGDVVVVALFVHGAFALRRVYGGRWWPTVLREALVLMVYGILVGLSAAAVGTWSLIA